MKKFNEFKRKARKNLLSHYYLITFTCLLSAFLGVEFTGTLAFVSRFNLNIKFGSRGFIAGVINLFTSKTLFNFLTKTINTIVGSKRSTEIILVILGFLITFIFWALVKNVYRVISRRIILEARMYKKVPASKFSFLIKVKKWFKTAKTMFIYSFYYFLWSLTIVGIFIKRYQYFLVPYIVAENPNISASNAIKLSQKMMDGHKWECFLLELSFIGYDILGVLTLGISSVIFSNGYISLTYAEYYANIRKEYIEKTGDLYEYLFDTYLYTKASNKLLRDAYSDVYDLIDNDSDIKLSGFKGFLYNNLGINLYSVNEIKKYEKQEINKSKIAAYSDTINGLVYPTRLYPIALKKRNKRRELDYMKSYSIPSLIMMFFSFSIIGWLWEVLFYLFEGGQFTNRGVLHGPWLPIYGTGALLIIILLKKFRSKPNLEFSLIVIICGLVEYFTSVYLEAKFGLLWWDYTDYFLNINGRVCAEGLIVFGVGGMAGVYVLAPLFDDYFNKISKKILYVLCIVLSCLYIFDKIYSGIYPNTGKNISFNTNMEGVINK